MKWTELVVTDADGVNYGTLAEVVESADVSLDGLTIEDGSIVEWHGFFLSAPDEEPDWDTPSGIVDWIGFEAALNASRGV